MPARVQFTFTFTNADPDQQVSIGPQTAKLYASASGEQIGNTLDLDKNSSVTVWSDSAFLEASTVDGEGLPLTAAATRDNPTITNGDGTAPANSPHAGGTSVALKDEGTTVLASPTSLNFVGAGVTATDGGSGVGTVTIPGASAITVQDEGTPLATAADTLNFVGGGVTATGAAGTKTITIPSGAAEPVTTVATGGSTQTLTLPAGGYQAWDITLTAATLTFTLAGAAAGTAGRYRVVLHQDGTGGRLVTWPAAVKWRNNVTPTLSTAPSAVDIFELVTVDGGTTYYGSRVDAAGIPLSTLAAKGDVLVATGAAAVTNLPVGSNGQALVADSTQASGVKWGSVAAAAPLTLTGSTDAVQLLVTGNATQTSDLIKAQTSASAAVFRVTNGGLVGTLGAIQSPQYNFKSNNSGAATSGQEWHLSAAGGTSGLQLVETGVAERMRFSTGGDIGMNMSGSALATNATLGFIHLPNTAGTPTGTPARSYTGATPVLIDTSGSKLWAYIGGAWKSVALA